MHTHWSKKEISLLRKYYPKLRVKDLVRILPNRTKSTIAVKALNLGLLSAKLWQPKENNVLCQYFAEAPIKQLLKLLPKRTKLAILAQGERLKLKRKIDKPRLRIDESYFKKWSANMTYILGFIFADGNITEVTHNGRSDKLGFGLNRKDIDILKKIKRALQAKQALSLSGKYVHFSVFSQVIVDDLKKMGITYRKSSPKNPCRLPNIPKKYIRDFIRGIVDGDGSICFGERGYPSLSICGREEMMTFIRNHFFSEFNIFSKISRIKKSKNYLFYIAYRCNSAKTLLNYLYKNAGIYLARKSRLAKRCSKIEMKHRKKYTMKEKQTIQRLYSFLPKYKILSMLRKRSWSSIQSQAHVLEIHKYNVEGR